jgi:hypothetical protein
MKFKKNQKTLLFRKKYLNFAIEFLIILKYKELGLTNLNRFGGMKKIIMLFTLCIAMSTNIFAQDEETFVYVATCNKDPHYHQSRYCKETKLCRHEHDKGAAKKCPDVCQHTGHMEAIELEKASIGRTPCTKCCDKSKTKKKDKKKK